MKMHSPRPINISARNQADIKSGKKRQCAKCKSILHSPQPVDISAKNGKVASHYSANYSKNEYFNSQQSAKYSKSKAMISMSVPLCKIHTKVIRAARGVYSPQTVDQKKQVLQINSKSSQKWISGTIQGESSLELTNSC
jgi:hypothetical protein